MCSGMFLASMLNRAFFKYVNEMKGGEKEVSGEKNLVSHLPDKEVL